MDRFLRDGKRIDGVWNDFMKKSKLNEKLIEFEITARWEELAGSLVARHTSSLRFSKEKLFIILDSAPLKQEINMRKRELIEKVNLGLGATLIQEIVIH
jgi:predicted nucleic acid-binding Zn ribbon protein